MRRTLIVLPELLGEPSVLRQKAPSLQRLAETGRLFKVAPMPVVETPEALFLGMGPEEGQLRQGPLTVSALGADPPDRSTHFHLSLLSYSDGVATAPQFEISPEDHRHLISLVKKLNTKLLTIVEGEGPDHGLVWEGLGDMRTTPATEVENQSIRPLLPEGDADILLRRLIDDSINLLSETEFNKQRIDRELPPLNLLWPWGDGVRRRLPNLALMRGEPAMVVSSSMRLQGLSRLVGYRHSTRGDLGKGTNTRLEEILKVAKANTVTAVVLDVFSTFRGTGQEEEADWFVRELDSRLLTPLVQAALLEPTRVTLLAPGRTTGLGVVFETGSHGANSVPFDERALEEKVLPTSDLGAAVESAVR